MGSLHHLDVCCADASIIRTKSDTFLIDCDSIGNFAHLLPASKVLRGVFVTHQHYDHYSGLQYLRENGYSIDFLIYSPYKRRHGDASVELDDWTVFEEHVEYFVKRGTETRVPYRQDDWSKAWWDAGEAKFWILGPDMATATNDARELHDASLVIHARLQTPGNNVRRCLFTGDASDKNLNYIAKNTLNICNDILHASHHGSINGADLDFIKACNAMYTVISTAPGRYENVPDPTALARYQNHTTKAVYRTDVDGTIRWEF